MTRSITYILIAAALLVALAVAVSERRMQAVFDAAHQESEGQLERVEAMARIGALMRDLGSRGGSEAAERTRVQAARTELGQTLASLRLQLPDGHDARRVELERLAAIAADGAIDDARRGDEARAAGERFFAAEARLRTRANERVEAAQRDATMTLRVALLLSATLTLLLGLGLSLKLVADATRLATATERIARGNLDAAVPPMTGALGELAPAVRRTAASLARRERETDALASLAALAPAAEPTSTAALDRLLDAVRQAIAGVLDVRALTLVVVDGERVRRLGTSRPDRQDAVYARAGSAVAAALARGDSIVFDVDRGVHPEDATARAAGAGAYAVVPLRPAGPLPGALVVDLGLSALAVAELRFLGLVGQLLAARLAVAATSPSPAPVSGRLSSLAHDLRTPLNAILGFSELLVDGAAGELAASQQRYAGNIRQAGQSLERLLADLIDLERLDAGRLTLVEESLPPAMLVGDLVTALAPAAAARRVALLAPPAAELPNVRVDGPQLDRALQRLVACAIARTPAGGSAGVELTPSLDGRTLRITVWDEGEAMEPEAAERLFQPFVAQATAQTTTGKATPQATPQSTIDGGARLGLALAQRLVQRMGGRLSVDVSGPRGARFAVDLPASAAPTTASRALALATRRALVVEDDGGARELLELRLVAAGFECQSVGSGEEALARARSWRPAVILLDLNLPGLDGWQVLRRLREDPETAAIPVVIASVSADRQTSFNLGAVEHLVKPYSADALLKTLGRRDLVTQARSRRVHVLLVDDDAQEVARARAALEPKGFDVVVAPTAALALEAARGGRFDVVMLGLQLPDRGGFEALAALRADARTRGTPIVLLDGHDLPPELRAQLRGDMAAVLDRAQGGLDELVAEVSRAATGSG